jgi:hypothetical protein
MLRRKAREALEALAKKQREISRNAELADDYKYNHRDKAGLLDKAGIAWSDAANKHGAWRSTQTQADQGPVTRKINEIGDRIEANPTVMAIERKWAANTPKFMSGSIWNPELNKHNNIVQGTAPPSEWGLPKTPAPVPVQEEPVYLGELDEGVGERHPDEEKPTKYQAAVNKLRVAKKK